MTARVIRVDWEAWAEAEAMARHVCGARAFVFRPAEVEREDVYERACTRLGVLPVSAPALPPPAKAEPMLPGVAAWLANRSRPL